MECVLCLGSDTQRVKELTAREFYRCLTCDLVFLNPSHQLSAKDEKTRYELHNNDVNDPRYRQFVLPLVEAICEQVPKGSRGLDFGAGPGPVVAQMLEERGYQMTRYDPFFWPELSVLKEQYDFIASSEVVEHFFNPREEFFRLAKLLKPNGVLGIMTLLRNEHTDLSQWYYLKDPTHVCAYSRATIQWIVENYHFKKPSFKGERVIVLE